MGGGEEDGGQEGTVTGRQMLAPFPSLLSHSPSIHRLTIWTGPSTMLCVRGHRVSFQREEAPKLPL